MNDKILIIGGTGEVGARLAAQLRPTHGDDVIVGARRPDMDVHAFRVVDLIDPASLESALDGVGTVVACVQQPRAQILEAAVERGLAYTSIAPPQLPWARLQELDVQAKRTGARIVVGTGIEPGIASVLVRAAAEELGGVDAVNTALLLGIGDAYGKDSMAFILEELAQTYEVTVGGKKETARAFDHAVSVDFPGIGRRRAYRMPFTDQLYYPRTLGAKTAVARIALDPPWLSDAIAALVHLGIRSGSATRRARLHSLTDRLKKRYRELHRFSLVVDVTFEGRSVRASLSGTGQADATAAGAAAVVEALHTGEVMRAGVFLVEQVIDPGAFFSRLRSSGFIPSVGTVTDRKVAPLPTDLHV